MIAQMRPDIATVTEETVLTLKELENRIGVLKNDLAWLCQGLGHAEAARLAAAPAPFQASNLGAFQQSPAAFAQQALQAQGLTASPYALSPYAAQAAAAQAAQAAQAAFQTPFGAAASASPFAPASATHASIGFASAIPSAFASAFPAAYPAAAFAPASAFAPSAAYGPYAGWQAAHQQAWSALAQAYPQAAYPQAAFPQAGFASPFGIAASTPSLAAPSAAYAYR